MTRAAPFGFNKVVFLSHVVGTKRAGVRAGSGSPATVFGLIP